jgi:succinate dehydrogenase/fumarate reductase flavoprotein subunit
MIELAKPLNAVLKNTKDLEPGTGEGRLFSSYAYPGGDTFYRTRVAEIPGFTGYDWVRRLTPQGVNMMHLVFGNVERRAIKIRKSTPAKRLVTDSSGVVIGVVAVEEGKEISIRARRGVILACGGFEQNDWMRKQYLQGVPFFSMAPLTHTGDGIIMGMKVGAALWHMWHVHGGYGYKYDEFDAAFRIPFSGSRNPKRVMPWIMVDKFGRRFMNEYPPAVQDTGHRWMETFDPDMPGYPRIPSYVIFDEAGRLRGPIAEPLGIGGQTYTWSKDNSVELAKGWIVKGDTLEELASKIKQRADNEGRMEGDTLAATVSQWNETVKAGKDALHRLPGTMFPVKEPPFYAAAVWPVVTNTQGGLKHDVDCRVLDAFGEVIPGLYAIGELGSTWAHLYRLAGNLGECFTTGRVAGRSAAARKG